MSGKPNLPQIEELRIAARRMAALMQEQTRQQEIYKAAVKNLETIDMEMRVHQGAIVELMTKMDIDSRGNTGWEGRITWFLAHLVKEQ